MNQAFAFPLFALAQTEGGPPTISVPGSSAEGTAPITPTNPGAGGQAPAPGGFNPLLLVGVLLVMMLLMTSLSARRERKKRNTLMATLKKHDRVQTTAGILGTVVEMGQDDVLLRVDEGSNTRIRFARSAIASIIKPTDEPRAKGDSRAEVEPKPGAKSLSL